MKVDTNRILATLLAATFSLLLNGGDAAAQAVPWSDLSPQEQSTLEPWSGRWNLLAEEHQHRLRRNAQRWQQLSPDERKALQERMGRWDEMRPEQRARMRERFDAYLQLPDDDQRRLRSEVHRFRALDPTARARLRQEFERMSPIERRAFLRGMEARDTFDAARQAFAFVPPEERARTLEMLEALGPEGRQMLRRIAFRLEPPARKELRHQLMELDAEKRLAFLRDRVGGR